MLIGLAAKNAILIVEFAARNTMNGKPSIDAALAGAELRLRPILMTAFAFILGCLPLWRATGCGRRFSSGARHRGHRRHAGRDLHRHLYRSGYVCCGRTYDAPLE